MKKGFVVTLLTCSLLSLATAAAASQQIRIQVAVPPHFSGIDFGTLAARLPEQAKVEIGSESDAPGIVEQVLQGKIDIAVVPTKSVAKVASDFAVFDLPFAVTEGATDKLFSGMFDQETTKYFAASLEKVGLGQIDNAVYGGTSVIASREPARSPRDFRGARVALLQDSPIREVLELAGAKPLSFKDTRGIQQAFEDNAVDAAEIPLVDLWRIGAPYVAMTQHRFSAHVVIYNQANYARLPSDVRTRVENAFGYSDTAAVVTQERARSTYGTVLQLDENLRGEWRNLVEKTQWRTIATIDKSLLSTLREPTRHYYVSYETGAKADLGWNTWFQSGSQTSTEQLIKDRDYNLMLDLGRDKYPGALSTEVEKEVIKEIERSPDGADISLLVRPIITGGVLMTRPDKPLVAKILRIERRKLVSQDSDVQMIQRAKSEKLPLSEISQALSVFEPLVWPVVAQRTGCAHIAFSIWNVSGLRPLDQIIVNVPVVGAEGNPAPDCATAISGGLDSLLSLDTPAGPTQADAALQFFDTGNQGEEDPKTVAVFVNRSELETALGNGQSPPVYSWKLKDELSQFLGLPDNLQKSIASAHDAIDGPQPFDNAVRQLTAAIFNTWDRSEEATAQHAKESLQQLTSRAEPPVIVARYFDKNGSMQYLPLALLAADASERVLSHRLTLVQPLTRGLPVSDDTCVDNWDFAIPSELEGAHAEAAELLTRTDWRPTGPDTHWYRNNLELLNFLRVRGAEQPPSSGFLLLAHHTNGSITYSGDAHPDRILNGEVQREFGRGSFAVLAACATSGASQESRNFIRHLLGNGVEAVVTSPFQVDTTFGTRFAVSFASVTKTSKEKGESARLLDLFNRAVDLTMQAYPEQPGYRDMALEFQIVGNHQLRLCNHSISGQ